MSFMVLTEKSEIKALLPRLKVASAPGQSNDGTRLMVHYRAMNHEPTRRQLYESELAREEGWDLNTYTGTLDRVWTSARGDMLFTMLVLERTNGDGRHHAYRSFNVERGELSQLVVLGQNHANAEHVHAQPQKPD